MSQPTWIGRTISGRYHIDELLGQGGMSVVYKATDPNLQRVVAIKIIHNHLSGDPDFIKRFEREAAAVAHLRHSNIIQVYDFNHDGDAYYIVFEYVAGVTLQDRLKKLNELHQQMPAAEAIDIAAGLGEAVHYAHKQGLVHRDIKPANVMLNSRNEPILMDFGIAKIVGGAKHTATGATLGTAQYMSPEQIKGEAIDARTDIYALGITLFEMLGGRSPFDADSTMAVMMMHVQNPVPDLRDIRRDVPVDVVMILKKAMAKEPDGRYQNAAQFVEALRNARLNLPSEEVTWAGGGVTAVEDRTMVEPMPPINATQKIDPPKGVTIVDAQPIQEQYVPVLLPSQQYPVRRRSKSKLLAPVLVVLVLALIVAGVWFAFFRGPSVEDLLAEADALAAAGEIDQAYTAYEAIFTETDPGNAAAKQGMIQVRLDEAEQADSLNEAVLIYEQLLTELDSENSIANSGLLDAKTELASEALSNKEYETAQELLTAVALERPDDIIVNQLFSSLLMVQKMFKESLPYSEKVLALEPDSEIANLNYAWAEFHTGEFDKAAQYFRTCTQIAPDNFECYNGLGRTLYELGRCEEAIDPLTKWAELNDMAIGPFNYLGRCYEKLGDFPQAITNFRQWTQLDPGNAEAHTSLGWALFNRGDYDLAAISFEKAVELDVDAARAYWGLGASYNKLGDPTKSLAYYKLAAEVSPGEMYPLIRLGWAQMAVKDYPNAANAFESALEMAVTDTEKADAYRGLGEAYRQQGIHDQALIYLQALSALEPDNLNVLLSLSQVHFAMENYPEAIKAANMILKQDRTFDKAYVVLGNSYIEGSDLPSAIDTYKTWTAVNPQNIEAFNALGWTYLLDSQPDNAILTFSDALSLDSAYVLSLRGRAQAYIRTGNCESAVPDLELILTINPDDERAVELMQQCKS